MSDSPEITQEVQIDPMRRGSSIFAPVGEGLSASVVMVEEGGMPYTHALRIAQASVRLVQEEANEAARRLHALRKESVILAGPVELSE